MSEYITEHYYDGESRTIRQHQREEIVRCRDCEYVDKVGYWCAHPSKTFIDEYGIEICNKVKPNGFCAWGERKEGGND